MCVAFLPSQRRRWRRRRMESCSRQGSDLQVWQERILSVHDTQ